MSYLREPEPPGGTDFETLKRRIRELEESLVSIGACPRCGGLPCGCDVAYIYQLTLQPIVNVSIPPDHPGLPRALAHELLDWMRQTWLNLEQISEEIDMAELVAVRDLAGGPDLLYSGPREVPFKTRKERTDGCDGTAPATGGR